MHGLYDRPKLSADTNGGSLRVLCKENSRIDDRARMDWQRCSFITKARKNAFMSNVVNLNTKPSIITKKGGYMA
jgi:hypothetical protein